MLLPGLPWVLLLPCFWRDLQEPWGMGGSRWKSGQSMTKWPGIMVKGNPSKMAFRLPGKLTVCYWTWPLKLGFIHRKRWFVMVENGLIINPPFPDTQERATGRPNMYLKVEKSRKITKNPPFDTPPTFEHIKYSWTWRFFSFHQRRWASTFQAYGKLELLKAIGAAKKARKTVVIIAVSRILERWSRIRPGTWGLYPLVI